LAYSVHPCGAETELGLGMPEYMYHGEFILLVPVSWMLTGGSVH
jgi:hypothetical protein